MCLNGKSTRLNGTVTLFHQMNITVVKAEFGRGRQVPSHDLSMRNAHTKTAMMLSNMGHNSPSKGRIRRAF